MSRSPSSSLRSEVPATSAAWSCSSTRSGWRGRSPIQMSAGSSMSAKWVTVTSFRWSTSRGKISRRCSGESAGSHGQGSEHRRRDLPRSRGGARSRDSSWRSETLQSHDRRARPGKDHGLRPGEVQPTFEPRGESPARRITWHRSNGAVSRSPSRQRCSGWDCSCMSSLRDAGAPRFREQRFDRRTRCRRASSTRLDPIVERIIRHCLERDPGLRPSSVGAVSTALERLALPPWRPAEGAAIPHRNHWVLRRKLGQGGFGETWLAEHAKTRDGRVFKFCNDAGKAEGVSSRDHVVSVLAGNTRRARRHRCARRLAPR